MSKNLFKPTPKSPPPSIEDIDCEIQYIWRSVRAIDFRVSQLVKALKGFLEDHEDVDDNGNANEAMQLLLELKELGVLIEVHDLDNPFPSMPRHGD